MPSGRTHAFATGLVGATALFFPLKTLEISILLSFGCFLGLVLYPDLDVNVGNYGNALVGAVFGKKLRKVWEMYWYPYSKIMPHRSFLSHLPVLSTAIRLIYIGMPIYILLNLLGISWGNDLQYVMFGLVSVDALHFVMDIVTTFFRRRF